MDHALALALLPGEEAATGEAGLTAGTPVLTLDGEMPVEHLASGDRVVTRNSGIAILVGVRRSPATAPLVRFAAGSLGHMRPEEDAVLGPGTRVLIRDWRAAALYGQASAMVAAARLVDGAYIQRAVFRDTALFMPEFDAAQVIYAGGLEIGVP